MLLHVGDPAPGYAFRHALVREAAYDELLDAERIAIHRAIADALERDEALSPGGELARTGEIAYHAMAAEDLPRALAASLAAVAVAEEASAHAEAEVHLDRILEIWPRVPDAAVAGRHGPPRPAGANRPCRSLSGPSVPRRSSSRTTRWPDSTRATRSAGSRSCSSSSTTRGRRPTSRPRSASSSRRCRCCVTSDPRRSAQAFAEAALLDWHQGRYTRAREAALQAIAIARDCGARRELALALTIVGQVYTHLGETNHAEESFAEAAGILEGVRRPGPPGAVDSVAVVDAVHAWPLRGELGPDSTRSRDRPARGFRRTLRREPPRRQSSRASSSSVDGRKLGRSASRSWPG